MADFSDAIAVANITTLKTLVPANGTIRKVTQLDATYAYPASLFVFILGATYTESLPGIVADNSNTGRWIMFPRPVILNSGDATGTAALPGIEWINTTSGDRFISNPDLSWSAIGGTGGYAYTNTTTSFVQPSVGTNVTINVGTSEMFAAGQYVYVETGGNYRIISKPGATQLQIQNTGAPGNAAPATTIPTSSLVTPSGVSGATGAVWGTITGTLTDQTDLLTALNARITDPMTTRGDLLYRDSSNITARLPIGLSGYVLTSNGTDVAWAAATGGFADPMTTRGDIIYRNSGNVTARLGAGTAGQVLTSDGTDISWATPASGFADPMTTRGDLIYRNSSNVTARLPLGTNGQVLGSNGTDALWVTPFSDPMTTAGDIIIRNGSNATARLGIGSTGHVLTVVGGVPAWSAPSGGVNTTVTALTWAPGATIDASSGANIFFSLTINATGTLLMSNIPTTGTRYGFELHLTWTSGTVTWPTSWTKGMNAPTTAGNYIITGVTIDGGTSFYIRVGY